MFDIYFRNQVYECFDVKFSLLINNLLSKSFSPQTAKLANNNRIIEIRFILPFFLHLNKITSVKFY